MHLHGMIHNQYAVCPIMSLLKLFYNVTAAAAAATAVTCGGAALPVSPSNASPWPQSCDRTVLSGTCNAACAANFVGSVSATCLVTGNWSAPTGTCGQTLCTGALPAAPANANPWPANCTGLSSGNACVGSCASGYAGSFNASCGVSGNWSAVSGGCARGEFAGWNCCLRHVSSSIRGSIRQLSTDLAWAGLFQ